MKYNFVYTLGTVLIAGGVVSAQAQGALPGTNPATNQSGKILTTRPLGTLPGVESAQEIAGSGTSPGGQLPGTGVQNGQGESTPLYGRLPGTGAPNVKLGGASPNDNAHPRADASASLGGGIKFAEASQRH
jgi:hypothetical protein